MPSPEEKDSRVVVGEELVIVTKPSLEDIALRVQILEKVIARAPFIGLDYSSELRKAELQRRDLIGRTVIPPE